MICLWVLYTEGLLDIALEDCEQAIAVQPDSPEAHHGGGLITAKLMRRDEAVASFGRAIHLKPDYPQTYDSRGNSLQARRRFEEAVKSYNPGFADGLAVS